LEVLDNPETGTPPQRMLFMTPRAGKLNCVELTIFALPWAVIPQANQFQVRADHQKPRWEKVTMERKTDLRVPWMDRS
ncbi:MAG: hypothetical protein JWM99_3202, partial [Verrucomicrobiales bacterium]|nr:hypothetical protein [Verrucomicrobiales bacterium]